MSQDKDTDMTLVFTLAALERLADPTGAVRNAREWSENIGVVSDGPPQQVSTFVDRNNVRADFTSGEGSVAGSLASVRQRFPTERHVFLGTDETDRALAQSLGWEYLSVDEAAAKADWQVNER